MRTASASWLLAFAACVPVPGATARDAGTASSPAAAGPANPVTVIAELVALLDEARRGSGCRGSLIWDDRIAAVAAAHSRDMAANGYFSHRDALGRDLMDRLQAARIPLQAAAENLALGPRGGREVFDGWRGSPGHDANMMNCLYTHHGVGVSGGYWTHVFVRPAEPRLR